MQHLLGFLDWDTINTGPEDRGPKDPRVRGPGTQGPRFLRAVLHCSS